MSRVNHLRRGKDRADLAKVEDVYYTVLFRYAGEPADDMLVEDETLDWDDPDVHSAVFSVDNDVLERAPKTGFVSVAQRPIARYTRAVHAQIRERFLAETAEGGFKYRETYYRGALGHIRYRLLNTTTDSFITRDAKTGTRSLWLRAGEGSDCARRLFCTAGKVPRGRLRRMIELLPAGECTVGQVEDAAEEAKQSVVLVNHLGDEILRVVHRGSAVIRGEVFGDHVRPVGPVDSVEKCRVGADLADVSYTGLSMTRQLTREGQWIKPPNAKTSELCAELQIESPFRTTSAWTREWLLPRSEMFPRGVQSLIESTAALPYWAGTLRRDERPAGEFIERDFRSCYHTIVNQMPLPYYGKGWKVPVERVTAEFITEMQARLTRWGLVPGELRTVAEGVSAHLERYGDRCLESVTDKLTKEFAKKAELFVERCDMLVTRWMNKRFVCRVDAAGVWFEERQDLSAPEGELCVGWTFGPACLPGFSSVPKGIVNLCLGCLQRQPSDILTVLECAEGSLSEPYVLDCAERYGWAMSRRTDGGASCVRRGVLRPDVAYRLIPTWVVAFAGMLLRRMIAETPATRFYAMCDGMVVNRGDRSEGPAEDIVAFGMSWPTCWKSMKSERILADYSSGEWTREEILTIRESRVRVVKGPAGSGKTTWIRARVAELGAGVCVVAPTNLAARNVSGETIHRVFGIFTGWQNVAAACARISRCKMVIVDECSMVGRKMYEQIMRVCLRCGVEVVFVGDWDNQLEPVNDCAVDWDAVGDVEELVGNYRAAVADAWEVRECTDVELYRQTLIVCWRNSTVDRINSGEDYAGWICDRTGQHARGEFIPRGGTFMGGEGYTRVRAVTCHKLQGQTLDRVVVHDELVQKGGRLLYVARTRARLATWSLCESDRDRVDPRETEEYHEEDFRDLE